MDIEEKILARWNKAKQELRLKHIAELDKLDADWTEILIKTKTLLKENPNAIKGFERIFT